MADARPNGISGGRPRTRVYSIELTSVCVSPAGARERRFDRLVTAEPAFVVGADMLVTAWNRALERLVGLGSRRVLGRPCYEVVASIANGSPPVCCHSACPLFAAALRGRPTTRVCLTLSGSRRAELATIARDGELIHLVEL